MKLDTQTADAGARASSPLHAPAKHESGYQHVSGAARYVDDLPSPPGTLVAWIVCSPIARGRITKFDASAAEAAPGVVAVLRADAIPGHGHIGPIVHDEPLLAEERLHYVGQPIAIVVGDDYEAVRDGAEAIALEVEADGDAPVLTIQDAIAAESFTGSPHTIKRGDVEAALEGAALRVTGETSTGAQDHFYLETQAALAIPEEGGDFTIYSSTQHPSEVQAEVAQVLGIGRNRVVCTVPRMGGGFGGKESQATPFAAMAALAAHVTGRPVRVWLNREQDMRITGKRHPFWSRYDAGFDGEGRLLALSVDIYSDGGWSSDLSLPVLDRALFHLDNAYYVPALRFCGRVCRTNLPSNTAFRGFGGPQGMYVIEEVMNRAAERLGLDPAELRAKNFYREDDEARSATPYGQVVTDNRLARLHAELMASSEYQRRRAALERRNAGSRWIKRGIGYQPVKFGISFTKSILNQAGAYVLIYADGTVQLNHGGTEMGQGLHTKMLAVCSHELGVPTRAIRVMRTATDKVPNTSATAASSGSDLNGQAVKQACETLRARLAAVACRMFGRDPAEADSLVFQGGRVLDPKLRALEFKAVAEQAWIDRVSLSATGYYRTPGIHYDPERGRGRPFYYFAYGGAVCEVELNGLTGEHRLLRVDILHDVGRSLVPTIDRGQVEGAFIQGAGWLTCEEVLFDGAGRPKTLGPSTYKIPALGDAPADFRVRLLERAPQPGVIHGSKAVGEPPFMLAIGVVTALRHAVAGFGPASREVELAAPCTPEALLRAVERQRTRG